MSTTTPTTPETPDTSRALRRKCLQNSEVNREVHEILADARALTERVESFTNQFSPDSALRAFWEDGLSPPVEGEQWDRLTFANAHQSAEGLTWVLKQFLTSFSMDLPPAPEPPCESPRVGEVVVTVEADFDRSGMHEGWTVAAWRALINSPANVSADRIYRLVSELVDVIEGHRGRFQQTDREIVEAAGASYPAFKWSDYFMRWQDHHFAGGLYLLTEFRDAIRDLIPDPETPDRSGSAPRAAA